MPDLIDNMSYVFVDSDDREWEYKAEFYFEWGGRKTRVGEEYWKVKPTHTEIMNLIEELLRDGELGLIVKSIVEEEKINALEKAKKVFAYVLTGEGGQDKAIDNIREVIKFINK